MCSVLLGSWLAGYVQCIARELVGWLCAECAVGELVGWLCAECAVGELAGWLCAVYCWGVGWLVMCRV